MKDKQAWLLQNIRGADGLLCMLSDKVTPEVIEAGTNYKHSTRVSDAEEYVAGPNLKVISTMSVGYGTFLFIRASRVSIQTLYFRARQPMRPNPRKPTVFPG